MSTIIPPLPTTPPTSVPQNVEPKFGSYLTSILPADVAVACGAFSVAMQQVRNISKINIEQFAQVVQNLETTRDLPLVAGTNVPVDATLAAVATASIAQGSGPNGTYRAGDFFGAMSGTPYNVKPVEAAINKLNTAALETIYDNILILLAGAGPYDAALQVLITAADTEINNILTASSAQAQYLNQLWDGLGTQLALEQAARPRGLSDLPADAEFSFGSRPTTELSFLDLFEQFSIATGPSEWSQTLEGIADWTTTGGQSIVALMREIRNKNRLSKIGIELDDTVPDNFNLEETAAQIANGDSYLEVNNLSPSPYGFYDAANQEYVVTNTAYGGEKVLDTGGPMVPGSLAA
jgi:hypothetical protein